MAMSVGSSVKKSGVRKMKRSTPEPRVASSDSLGAPLLQESAMSREENPKANVNNHKEPLIENLFEFLGLQSFDGKFLPNESFYKFFYKNNSNDFVNLKQEIEKEMGII